jgi:protein-disulfide isomerase
VEKSLTSLLVVASLMGCASSAGTAPPPPPPPAPVASPAPVEEATAPWKQEARVPVSSDDPALGPKNAAVTIVMFSDFQCPFCQRVEPTIAELRAKYGDDLRVVWKDLPLDFHANAEPAATVARVAFLAKGDAAFWHVHDRMFAAQDQLGPESYVRWLSEVGVDQAKYEQLAPAAVAAVRANLELSKQLNVQGTPNFFIDGERLTGAQPVEKFQVVIDAHLEKAKNLRKAGVPDAALYGAMVESYFLAQPTPDPTPEPPEDTSTWNVQLGDAPTRGPKDARVTIVEFADFQCPFCKRHEATLARIEKEYEGKVRLVWKHEPLTYHKRAMPAAIASYEVYKQKGSAAFFHYRDLLFAKQPNLEDTDLEAAAREIKGVDAGKVLKAVTTSKWQSVIEADLDQGDELKVGGTPKAFVNGRVVDGAVAYEKFAKIVEEELAKAEAKIKAGTPADKVYAETIKGGKGGPLEPLAVPASAPWKGGKDAKVVIHVFSDFQCPFCRRSEIPMIDANGQSDPMSAGLRASADKYKDKIKIVWRNFPLTFHPRARAAANFALEAFKQKGLATFWKVHDALFESQPKLEDADLEAIAKANGIDWVKAKHAIDTDAYKAEIDLDLKDGGAVGVSGTPAFLVQTKTSAKLVVGAQPGEAFFRAIDAALAKAK